MIAGASRLLGLGLPEGLTNLRAMLVPQNERTHRRKHGRSLRGTRTRSRAFQFRGVRYSMLPVMTAAGILNSYICQGSINGQRLIDYGQRCLVRA